jgi:hypothetical protein
MQASSVEMKAARVPKLEDSGPNLPKQPTSQTEFEVAWLQWERDALARDRQLQPAEQVQNIASRMQVYHAALTARVNDRSVSMIHPQADVTEHENALRRAIEATHAEILRNKPADFIVDETKEVWRLNQKRSSTPAQKEVPATSKAPSTTKSSASSTDKSETIFRDLEEAVYLRNLVENPCLATLSPARPSAPRTAMEERGGSRGPGPGPGKGKGKGKSSEEREASKGPGKGKGKGSEEREASKGPGKGPGRLEPRPADLGF